MKLAIESAKDQTLLRAMVDNIPNLAWVAHADGFIFWYNKRWYEFTGSTEQDMEGWGWQSVHDPDILPQVIDRWDRSIKTGEPFEMIFPLRRYDGVFHSFLTRVVPLQDDDGAIHHWFGTNTDITEQLEAQEALRESEEHLRALVNATSDVIYRMSPDWKEMRQLDGRNFLADTGKPDRHWLEKYIHPNDQKRVLAAIQKAIDTKSVFQLEHQVRQADGELGWTFSRAIPIRNEAGEIIEWFGAASDITERKRHEEERRKQHEIEQRVKMMTEQRDALLRISEAKAEFVSVASHQLRTPATIVKQYTELLLNQLVGPLNPRQIDYLQKAYDSNERELRIIDDLLKTAQIDDKSYMIHRKTTDVMKLIHGAIEELRTTFEQRGQRVTFQHKVDQLTAEMDEGEIRLALVNLLENASKYSYPNSEIIVKLAIKKNYMELSIRDKGVGIRKKDQEKIFEKFTRVTNELSDTVGGTGLGLYWVKQIIELHKGDITLMSSIGVGSTFIIKLPL